MGRAYVFDIETNGFLEKLNTIHSLVLQDVETGEVFSFHKTRDVTRGLEMLMEADLIVGHNIIKFDIPAITKVFPWFKIDKKKVFDTLVASRLIWTNLADTDQIKIKRNQTELVRKFIGSHGLEAWGLRLGNWKGDYAKTMEAEGKDPWASWNQMMQDYCEQDVAVNYDLYQLILSKNYAQQALDLEHSIAHIMAEVERTGFAFDVQNAEKLYVELLQRKEEMLVELRDIFKPWYSKDGVKKTPKRPNKRLGYCGYTDEEGNFVGAEYQPVKINIFNPNSRDHISDRLISLYGWKPEVFTDGGKPKVDEVVLKKLKYPEAPALAEYMMLQKRLGQLGDGRNAWLKLVSPEGRLHGSINTNGAVTGRATHSNPNIGQVPSGSALYGPECRALFTARQGITYLLGCDVSGLELRMLGHFMARYDGGAYLREVIEGDVHWLNAQMAGFIPQGTVRDPHNPEHNLARARAKTFIYAFLYGAGDAKIGTIIGKGAKAGREIKKVFFAGLPALKQLIDGVKAKAKSTGKLRGLDGRELHIRSDHAALNTLLQSAGALVCKQWIVHFYEMLEERCLSHLVSIVAWVHDEIQMELAINLTYRNEENDLRSEVGEICIEAIKKAGETFSLRVELDGEYDIGNNWKETH